MIKEGNGRGVGGGGLSHPGNCFSLTFKIVHSEVVYKCMKKKVS
jgi:hypothetical protein